MIEDHGDNIYLDITLDLVNTETFRCERQICVDVIVVLHEVVIIHAGALLEEELQFDACFIVSIYAKA